MAWHQFYIQRHQFWSHVTKPHVYLIEWSCWSSKCIRLILFLGRALKVETKKMMQIVEFFFCFRWRFTVISLFKYPIYVDIQYIKQSNVFYSGILCPGKEVNIVCHYGSRLIKQFLEVAKHLHNFFFLLFFWVKRVSMSREYKSFTGFLFIFRCEFFFFVCYSFDGQCLRVIFFHRKQSK